MATLLLLQGCSETASSSVETKNTLVSFKVVYPNGDAAVGTSVIVRPDNYNVSNDKKSADVIELETDSEGNLEISSIESGNFSIEMNDNHSYASLLELSINSSTGDTTLNDQILKPYAIVSGVIDSSVNSSENIIVRINGIDRSTIVDATGSFTFDDLPEGDYTLEAVSSNSDVSIILENVSAISNSETELIISSDGYKYQSSVIINTTETGANIDENLYEFPLLVRLDSSNIGSTSSLPYVENLEIINAKGKSLPYEIESWNGLTQQAVLWVVVDTIFAQASTNLTMSWSSSATELPLQNSVVFDTSNGYAGVWHLESSDVVKNETKTGDGENFGCSDIEGIIGGAYNFENSSYAMLPEAVFSGLDKEVTVSLWQYGATSDTLGQTTLFDGRVSDTTETHLVTAYLPWIWNDTYQVIWDAGVDTTAQNRIKYGVEAPLVQGNWNYWTFTKNGTSGDIKIYCNGEICVEGVFRFGTVKGITLFKLGGDLSAETPEQYAYNGSIDEFRISQTERKESWIKMSYETQKIASTVVRVSN